MKTSNVLLISLFVTCMALTSAVPIVVNFKLKDRDFILLRNPKYDQRKLGASKFITLKGFGGCTLVPSDSLTLEAEHGQMKHISMDQVGDTLVITNKVLTGNGQNFPILYLPAVDQITCIDSNIELKGALISESARSYRINLLNSHIVIKGREVALTPYRQFFGELFIRGADNSGLDLSSNLTIQSLQLQNVRHLVTSGYSVEIQEMNTTFDPKAVVKMRSAQGEIEINSIP